MTEAGAESMRSDPKRSGLSAVPSPLREILRASDGILDLLPIAAFICDEHGTILQYNRHAVEIWGRAPQPGETHEQFTEPCKFLNLDGTPRQHSMLAEVLRSGESVRNRELLVERADGLRVAVSLNIDPLRNARGELIGIVNCFVDISERKRVDAALERSQHELREQEQRLAATYDHAAIGISEVAADGHFLRVNETMATITGFDKDTLAHSRLFTHTHPADADPDREAFRKQVAGDLDFYSIEKRFIRKDGRVIWIAVRSSPVRDASGSFLYAVRVVQDITERKASEERQKLLIDELNHRVKNTLATVQSLASQSARGSPSPEDFRERFEGRLIALSKAHDQLTRRHWASADLRDILVASLAPYMTPGHEHVRLVGEDTTLRPRAALTLAMAFHELTNNAAKYGALSVPSGHIDIAWRAEAGRLHIAWEERGGPPVVKPKRRGFGTRMIEGSVAAELHGSATLAYEPGGLRCVIDVPFERGEDAGRGEG
jgi:PAS domain S-box-containing protein